MSTASFGFDDLAQFLEPAEKMVLPIVPSGDFTPTGFTAPWLAQMVYTIGDQQDYSKEEVPYDFRTRMGEWGWQYCFIDHEAAGQAKTAMGKEFGAQATWIWRTDTASVLFANEEARGKFGTVLSYPARISNFWKYRHEFGMISLPSAVSALATLVGYDPAPFDVELLSGLPTEISDAEAVALIGDKKSYEESMLWKQRVEIWRSLGEENPKVDRPMGTSTVKGEPSPVATTSEKLSKCLQVFYQGWSRPLWWRLMPLPDPRVNALSSKGNRLTIPAPVQMYQNEADAVADWSKTAIPAGNGPATTAEPPVPAIWKDWPQEWHKLVQRVGSAGMPLPVAYEKEGGEGTVGCTLPELKAWVDYLKA